MPRFVEVGAFDCQSWSHTYPLGLDGWEGLMFEPQPDMIALCKECYKDYPNITIEECAIGEHNNRDIKLYLFGSLTTVRQDMIKVFNDQGYGIKESHFILVRMYTLDDRLEHYNWQPDFELLVVDVEGAEMQVLNGFTISKWRPKKVIIEACDPCPDPVLFERTTRVREYMTANGYKETGQELFDLIFEIGDTHD